MEKRKIKVGLLLDTFEVPAWAARLIENIAASDFAEITLVVLNDNTEEVPAPNKALVSKLINNRDRLGSVVVRKLLETAYSALIERNTYLPDANQPINCESLIKHCPVIKAKTRRTTWCDYFYEDDIEAIRNLAPDLLFRCGFRILKGDILSCAKYGVWSFHHGDNLTNRGGPAGFWESMESWPETGSILQILTEDIDNGAVLYRSHSCTNTMSVHDNVNNYYWKSLSFMQRKIRELYDRGESEFFSDVAFNNRHPVFYSERLYRRPTNRELARLTVNKIIEKTKLLYTNAFFLDQWILLFHLKNEFSSSLWRYQKIIPPKDRFWADPHVIRRHNKYYIFIEEYLYSTQKGHIAVMEMDDDGCYSEPAPILEAPYHLSYPFVFEHHNELYMIPESAENRTIELYKCVEFPSKWEFQMNLMEDVEAVDTTIYFQNNRFWMFTNLAENVGASTWDELFLFYSNTFPSRNWTPHPQNPVVSDCKSARPAGKLFLENGRLYRPSQNCSHHYGYGFNLNEITRLDDKAYAENVVSRVKPHWDQQIRGCHTFNREHSLHIIDAIYRRRKYL
ncbi:hypothetical protein FHR99_002081 [Litorivivens lipolytica]|uniref:Glucosamine inositolphosphorylceramide transferase 1 N-terminal domain-containing protein n=1 Tax=Litorivivens lipolytica TaxID=1524264 RepID=A0A7W4W5I0_9GAMM|nr:hypothetical protein [Litorivivens lipolytica]MBB3047815.1 hypothetical protein [Litorivivens lipolytica]